MSASSRRARLRRDVRRPNARHQSPVDLEKLATFYGSINVEVRWTALAVTTQHGAQGVVFAVTNPPAQVLLVDAEAYWAVQFHAHGPSEHKLGTPRAGELHIVHQHLDDLAAGRPLQRSRLAVLGVFLEEGDASGPHPAMQISRALRDLREGKPTDPTEVKYSLDDLLPPERTARRMRVPSPPEDARKW